MRLILITLGVVFTLSVRSNSQAVPKQRDTATYKAKELTVTATRDAHPNLDVPMAVTIVTKDMFENNRGYGLDEVLTLVPGALVQSRAGNQDVRVVIRGFGARGAGQRSNAGTTRGIRFYQDGIPETEPDGRTAFDLIDLAGASSVEVLRSNASALWGNAAGGVVSITTVPTETTPFCKVQNTNGSFGFQKQSVQMGSPLGLGKVFVSVNNTNFEGWRDHSGSTLFQFNGGIVSELSTATKLKVLLVGASNLFRIPGPLTQTQFDSSETQAQNLGSYAYQLRDERRFNRLGRLGATLDHKLDQNSTISATAFIQNKVLQRSERNTFRDFNRYHTGGNVLYRRRFQISSSVGNEMMIGADNQYQDGAILFYDLVDGRRGDTLRDNKREGANNFGVFFQNELILGADFTILLGARYDRISYFNEIFPTATSRATRTSGKTFTQITPKAGVNYRISPTMSVYASLGGGIEVPAGNEVDPKTDDPLANIFNSSLNDPIRSTTLEVGFKHKMDIDPDGAVKDLSYDVALYSIRVTNDLIPYRDGRFYLPAGTNNRRGVEFGFAARFFAGFTLSATATFASNTYSSYIIDSSLTKSTFDSSLLGKSADYSGNTMPGIPDYFGTFRLRWVPQDLRQLFVEAEMRTFGASYANDANSIRANAYSVMDISAGITQQLWLGLSLRAVARVNNLANTKYVASPWINPDLLGSPPSPAFIDPGMSRNWVITVGLAYNW